jgi:hypothetical protein
MPGRTSTRGVGGSSAGAVMSAGCGAQDLLYVVPVQLGPGRRLEVDDGLVAEAAPEATYAGSREPVCP